MNIRSFLACAARALTVAMLICLASASLTSSTLAQGPARPNLSPEEQTMVKAILAAPNPAAKLKAVEALIKQHRKTPVRDRVAHEAANQLADLKDSAGRVAVAEQH